jgi:hypothetical protein
MANSDWLVVLIILKKYEFVNGKDYCIPYIYKHYGNGIIIMENKTCLKPPTSQPWVVKTQQRWCYKSNKTWKISGFHQHSEL